jgi:superfamily II DNA or RNA helicase
MSELKVVAREAFFIKIEDIGKKLKDKIIDHYTYRFYEEKSCKECEWLIERHSDNCEDCAAYKGGIQMAKIEKIGDTKYLSTPIGDKAGLTKLLEKKGHEVKLRKKHKDTDFKRPIKFTGTLKPDQKQAVKAIFKYKMGVVKAPPRSGKTVLSSAAVCMIGKKTIILAAQHSWLAGFRETFLGSKTQKPLTNAREKRVGYARKYADFLKYDVCLVTYQTFNSEGGQKLLKKIRDLFNVLVVDEVHGAAANKYAYALSRLNVEYRIGLSGTPSRKDGRMILASNLMGPIIHESIVKRLRPTIHLTRTAYSKADTKSKARSGWSLMVGALEKDKKRIKLIAKWALYDVKNGHMVMIPFTQQKPIAMCIAKINEMAGRKIAYPFHGKISKNMRDEYIDKARNYKIQVLVGNAKMMSTGINIPRASMLYEVTLSSNMENCEQRISRVLTPYDGKPSPGVRMFLDDTAVRKRCFANEYWGCIHKVFKPIIADKDLTALKSYFSAKKVINHWEL